jgi:hypothetical protein
MSTTCHRLLLVCGLAPLACVLAMSRPASADNFGPVHYDSATNELVVTILYGGTNSNHKFTLKWGPCQIDESGHRIPLVNADMLDDQFNDAEQQQYTLVKRFSLADMPCPRPAKVSVSTAPGFSFDLMIPK